MTSLNIIVQPYVNLQPQLTWCFRLIWRPSEEYNLCWPLGPERDMGLCILNNK